MSVSYRYTARAATETNSAKAGSYAVQTDHLLNKTFCERFISMVLCAADIGSFWRLIAVSPSANVMSDA